MAEKVGKVLILKLSGQMTHDDAHTGQRYLDVTKYFEGKDYNDPTMVGSFVEVEVMRSFAVKEVPTFTVFELDPESD